MLTIKLTYPSGASFEAHMNYKKEIPAVKIITNGYLAPEYQEKVKNLGAKMIDADEYDFPAPDFGEPPFFDFLTFWEKEDPHTASINSELERVKNLLSTIWTITEK